MGCGGRGVTRASVSGLPTQQVSREPTQFSSLKGKERNPHGWIRVHTLDGAGGGPLSTQEGSSPSPSWKKIEWAPCLPAELGDH